MAGQIPSELDYRRLLAGDGELDGSIPGATFDRLGENFRACDDATASLRLHKPGARKAVLTGRFAVPLEARCQRCLEWMPLQLEGQLKLVVNDPENPPEGLADDEDTVEVVDGLLPIWRTIEDEIVLACPMIPVHREACTGKSQKEPARHKPFAALADLLEKDKLPRS